MLGGVLEGWPEWVTSWVESLGVLECTLLRKRTRAAAEVIASNSYAATLSCLIVRQTRGGVNNLRPGWWRSRRTNAPVGSTTGPRKWRDVNGEMRGGGLLQSQSARYQQPRVRERLLKPPSTSCVREQRYFLAVG